MASSMCATALIERYGVDLMVVTGVAGALFKQPTDAPYVIRAAVQHDYGDNQSYNHTVLHRPGQVPIGVSTMDNEYYPDEHLTDTLQTISVEGYLPYAARIASGDIFVNNRAMLKVIHSRSLCNLVDMETAAVAQVCDTYNLPWCAVKSISDDGNETAFALNLEAAVRRSTVLVERLIESL